MEYLKVIYWLILLKYVKTQEEWDPDKPFIENEAEKDRVQFGAYININQFITMDENIETNIIIAFMAYTGSVKPTLKFSEPSSTSNDILGVVFDRPNSEAKWSLVVTMKQDYEGKDEGFRYGFDITASGITRRVYLSINNLDDENPIIEILDNPCKIEENKVGVSNCRYIIRDADGVMNKEMHYTLTGSTEVEALFEIKNEIDLEDGIKEWTVVLNTIKCLDFESTSLYLLDFTVTDSGNNKGTAKIVINVIDMPDRPPVWKNIFSSQQFDEKTKQIFQVEAVDGDVVINNPIHYNLISEWPTLFSIKKESGEITVNEIDRDELQKQIFTFQVIAYEEPDPSWFIDQYVTIIVNDINDNVPVISVKPKSITIPENTATKLQFEIEIKDMDLGDNGTYTVSLQDSKGNDHHTAFQIVPDEGYQLSKFTIAVMDSSLLDFEVESWQTITVEINAQEKSEEAHFDSTTIQILLENLNDEYPEFEFESYTATVFEDIGEDEFIATVLALDKDVDDEVIHSLQGKAIKELFTINKQTGEIRTLDKNAFDYEKEMEVVIQVQAEDQLYGVHHRVTTQLIITVEDVNDEAPRITVPTTQIGIKENREHGTLVNNEITATDEDTTADLVFNINWDDSYATKNGQNVSKNYYEGCIDVKTEKYLYSDHVKALLTVNEIMENNTPDYEKLDKLYISLVVKDQDQTILPNTDKVMIIINIEDLNDNPPIFDKDSINAMKRVTERASSGTRIATIIAEDADGPQHNQIVYSIRPLDDTIPTDWVAIDPNRGELYVEADEKIDADGDLDVGRPAFWILKYIVTAVNDNLEATANIEINVIDINDNPPIITVFNKVVKIHEASPNNSDVQTIAVTDADRDEAYNTPWFRFGSSVSNEIKSFFSIDSRSGRVYVHYKDSNNILNRDKGTQNFSIPIIIGDNYDLIGTDGRQNIKDDSFMVILLDINNQYPTIDDEIKNINLNTSEKTIKGEYVGEFQAFDDDEPKTDNTKMKFTILTIEKGNGASKDPPNDLFSVSTDSNYVTGLGKLTAESDLKGYYGTYNVLIKTNDFGTYPKQLHTEKTIYVHIYKYNFHKPEIIYPTDEEKIYLEEEQALGEPLIKYGGNPLDIFYATDCQNEKWNIVFYIDEAYDEGVFTLISAGPSRSRLVLNTKPNRPAYTLKIVANCNCIGEEPYTDSVMIHIRFLSENSEPYFTVTEVIEEFPENTSGLDTTKQLPKAYFEEGEEWEFKIYYELKEDSSGCFEVGAETAVLGLTKMLDREKEQNHTLKIAASKNPGGNNKPDEKSILTVFVKVLDVNDNPPNFENSLYYAGIKPSDVLGALILTVTATDLDINDTLTFSTIEESFKANGNGISDITNPFITKSENKNTYQIFLNFAVQSNMNGYFLFDITVTDEENHSDTATVKIYVVSDSSRTAFKFENNINDVEPKKNEIQEILEEQFSYICNLENVQKGTNDNGEPVDNETNVIVHFINPTTNEAIDSTEIVQIANDLEFFMALRSKFLKEALYLLSFTNPSYEENMEEVLRAWLIGVSVILGTLCIALIIAFILKTRSLTQRLSNLSTTKFGSQESGLNRMGIAAPNTNKHAIEGSNPVYNEEKVMANIDTASIGSGDSDLIGIEDNPNFEYLPEMRQENNNFISKERQ